MAASETTIAVRVVLIAALVGCRSSDSGTTATGTGPTGEVGSSAGEGSSTATQSSAGTAESTDDGFGFLPPMDVGSSDMGPVDSYADDIEPIWNGHCVIYCHGIPNPKEDLDLDWGKGYDLLVNQPSSQSELMLVVPESPQDSYLWHKLNDTHLDVGGEGDPMPPLDVDLLDPKIRDRIETWILIGAPP